MVSSTTTPFSETTQEKKLREFVSLAFDKKTRGDSAGFNTILKQLTITTDPIALKKWYYVLRQRVSTISQSTDFQELVPALLKFDNWNDNDVTEDFVSLIADIVSSNGCYVVPCFQVFVKNFLPRRKPQSNEFDMERSATIANNTHLALRNLISLVPSSPTSLFPVLLELFPHKRLELQTHEMYVSNLLRLSSYCPVLRDRILALIIEKIIQIDVEIKLEEVVEDEDDEQQFALEIEKEGGEALRNSIESKQLEISEMAEKLDSLMKLMFEYLQSLQCNNDEKILDEIFNLFLRLFDCAILNTHKSKYTQFLLFFMCQLQVHYTKCFLGYLLNKLTDPSHQSLTRCTCAAYVGSFISRSALVSLPIIKSCLFELSKWAQQYLELYGDSVPDAQQHDVFYAVCQSICYIFCFKHKVLLDSDVNRAFSSSLNIEKLVYSRLNPFKICLYTVVNEFARLSKARGFLDCESVVERNRRLVLPTKSSYGGYNQIDSFFPFDPYLLKNSASYIQPTYHNWKKFDEEGDEEEDDDENEDEEGDLEEDVEEEESYSESGSTFTGSTAESYEGARSIWYVPRHYLMTVKSPSSTSPIPFLTCTSPSSPPSSSQQHSLTLSSSSSSSSSSWLSSNSRRFQEEFQEDLMSYTPDFSHEISLNDFIKFNNPVST